MAALSLRACRYFFKNLNTRLLASVHVSSIQYHAMQQRSQVQPGMTLSSRVQAQSVSGSTLEEREERRGSLGSKEVEVTEEQIAWKNKEPTDLAGKDPRKYKKGYVQILPYPPSWITLD